MWENRAALHHAQLAEAVNGASIATNQTLGGLSALGMGREQGLSFINRLIDQQAFMLSANDIFAASSLLFLGLIAVVWLARPSRSGAAVDAGGAH